MKNKAVPKIRFLFFSKTAWSEPPRLRHQLARLLAQAGHKVHFFQRPRFLHEPGESLRSNERGICLHQTGQLIHHKARIGIIFSWLNEKYESHQIRTTSVYQNTDSTSVVVNFNYEYFFLRKLFPKNRIITIINDKFWARALPGCGRFLKGALRKTCKISDRVLTVSVPLKKELSEFCRPFIFFPWSQAGYRRPSRSCRRNLLLFWGYLDDRIDYGFILKLANLLLIKKIPLTILMSGPHIPVMQPFLSAPKLPPNLVVLPAQPLENLPTNRALAGILPYRTNNPYNMAISLPNRSLQLLALGLPLCVRGAPAVLKQPFIFPLPQNAQSCPILFKKIQKRFQILQPSIKKFVDANNPANRLAQFLGYCS